jgi:hypothetical protein
MISGHSRNKECKRIEVTINTIYTTLSIYMYCPLLEDILIATCFGSVEPSTGNKNNIFQ